MIYTNLLVKAHFEEVGSNTEFDVSDIYPTGALTQAHMQIRYRPNGAYWSAWGPVDSWDNSTRIVTWSRPLLDLSMIEIRRQTPRYALFLDPLATTARVSETNFHANADQGLFVASEWAAQYGIDVNAAGLPDYDDGPNTLGLVQQTQNHWGSNADFSKTTWDFQFSGGYIAREHVHAAALLPSGWTELEIDPAENDPGDPSDSPFRFIGDYQLRLDLATLGAPVTGLVVYRKTPRNVNVAVVGDDQRITAPGMEPSARHAFFVAVEIGEELAKRVPPCECALFYTSTIYPLIVDDTLANGVPQLPVGLFWGILADTLGNDVPMLVDGSLDASIIFLDYVNWRDIAPDTLSNDPPLIVSGTLVSSINFVDYVNWRDIAPDTLATAVATLVSGTLIQTISFVDYTHWQDFPDTLANGVPTLQSGTLV